MWFLFLVWFIELALFVSRVADCSGGCTEFLLQNPVVPTPKHDLMSFLRFLQSLSRTIKQRKQKRMLNARMSLLMARKSVSEESKRCAKRKAARLCALTFLLLAKLSRRC